MYHVVNQAFQAGHETVRSETKASSPFPFLANTTGFFARCSYKDVKHTFKFYFTTKG
jgi:hypothetical protein